MSRGRYLRALAAALSMVGGLGASPATAPAARVIVLGPGARVLVRDDPFLTLPARAPAPLPDSAGRRRSSIDARSAVSPRTDRNVRTELARLRRRHAISAAAYWRYLGVFNAALATVRRLRDTRATELGAVIANLHGIAAARLLTPTRLPALFLTLARNRQWWTTGPMIASGQRVEFAGSELVWEYYGGQGLELQQLGSFGKANGLYSGGRSDYRRMRHLLSELIPLAARRGGGLTWEYYFSFDGGVPPWTSAMSQGTALEALTRAYEGFGDRAYLSLAGHALGVFETAPPTGVGVRTWRGRRYLLYSFAPGAAVINGFLQSLVGLYDYAHASGDRQAARLFAAGDAEARAELPAYDTGAWSLYEPGQEDTLDYHQLVTGFLHELCSRTRAPVYCTTASHFDGYLKTPPALGLLISMARAGAAGLSIRFRLSKAAHVGIVVVRNGRTLFLTSASFGHGVQAFSVPALKQPGSYTIRLAATDLAGNFARIVRTLQIRR